MRNILELTRRRFLSMLAAVGLARAASPPASTAKPLNLVQISSSGYQALDAHQAATLGAIADQIVPPDQDPGGREAGAVTYIDRVLSGEQREKRALYSAGLEGTDQTSQLNFGHDFVDLSFEQQTSVLKAIEQGQAQGEIWRAVSSGDFFALVWNHVLEGFYGPPEHGGNRNFASWKMVGFPEHSGTM